jgi:cell wall-associated NlpC family hydrolase
MRHGGLLRAGALLTLVGLLVAPVAVPAHADPDLTSARAAADVLRDKVDRLTAQAEAAAEDYGAAALALEDVVSELLTADQGVDTATRAAERAEGRTADAARQLYMTGGPGAIYASVLEGHDISDVLSRMASVDSVVAGDIVATSDARAELRAATATWDRLAELTARKRALEATRAAARDRAAALRAEARAALAGAEGVVRRLVEEERARAEAAAEAAARASMTAPWGAAAVPADSYAALDRAIAEARSAPATPYAVAALLDARRWLGTPYSAGGGGTNGPSTGWCSDSAPDDGRGDDGDCAAERTVGFDCSSLMLRVFSVAGLALPRTSRQQWYAGTRVALRDLAPGDLLFWAYDTSSPGSIHHVALYLGHGLMVHAPHTGDHVRVAEVYLRGYIGAVRPG